ncbi:MAG: hypothetical protein CMP24_02355 [Rickettsiales bacterium]|nr:hypothetical protein [Rickettsiales bacterium]|tara:strand:+ start:143 stop:331 length:189 start_codon:yes stop_codon:yes gene_type:complete
MDEIEIISPKDVIENIEKASLEDLIEYKSKLKKHISEIDKEITNRKNKKDEAEKIFKNIEKK